MMQPLSLRPLPVTFALALFLSALVAGASGAATLDRPADPVVLTGADVSALLGAAPGDIVAFRYDSGWVQIPVQVDERAVVDFADIYNHLGGVTETVTALQYTDAGTYTGADPDATLDANDEIVFMAADAGDRPPIFSDPAGVVPGSGVQIEISDPLDAGEGTVYLFERSGGLDPGAGANYADYQFDLVAGVYPDDYDIANGPNPEDSTVTTAYYTLHLADRWIVDEMRVLAGSAERRRHPRPPQAPLRTRRLPAERGHLRRRRGGLRRQQERTRPRHPLACWARTAARSPRRPSSSTRSAKTSSPTSACTPSRA